MQEKTKLLALQLFVSQDTCVNLQNTILNIGVGRGGPGGGGGGGGGGGRPPPQYFERGGGANIPFGPPPNNPPIFSFNFYVHKKSQMYQVEG